MTLRCLLLLAFIGFTACPTRGASFVFDTNRVVSIEIKLSPEKWNELRYQHREAEFFPEEGDVKPTNAYTWFPAELIIDGQRAGTAHVRKKGYIGSNDSRRPGLKLKFTNGSAGSASAALTEVALNNNLQDPSLIRQFISYEVFRRAGVPAPRCSFASVTVNGKSLGIYSCVEPVNAAFLRDRFGRADGNLYEGGRSDFRAGWSENFDLKNNHEKNDRSDLRAVTDAVEQSSDGSLLDVLNRLFDEGEFMRFWASECLVNQIDGYAGNMNNFYLYRNPSTKRFVFIPWGTDSTLSPGRALNGVRGDPKSVIGVSILANRLYRSAEGAKLYRATLTKLLEEAWKEDELLRTVDRLEKQLAPLVQANESDFKQNVAQVSDFIRTRRGELMPELEGPLPELKSRPIPNAKRRKVGQFTAHFSTRVSAGDSPAPNAPKPSLAGTLWNKNLAFGQVSVQAFVPPIQSEQLANIVFSGVTTAGGRQYYLQLAIDPDSYTAGKPIPIDNTHIRGYLSGNDGRGNGRYIGMLRGTLLLNKASREPGGDIEGELNVDVFSKLPKPAE